jgi:hypothetical protein
LEGILQHPAAEVVNVIVQALAVVDSQQGKLQGRPACGARAAAVVV